MDVWQRVVNDLEAYNAKKRKQRSTMNKVITFLKKSLGSSCGGDCCQGRYSCNCEKKNG